MSKILTMREMLKSQEPMYLELRNIHEFEFEIEKVMKPTESMTWDMDDNEVPIIYFRSNGLAYSRASYGNYWRCWNEMPTEIERQNVLWGELSERKNCK